MSSDIQSGNSNMPKNVDNDLGIGEKDIWSNGV